MKERKKKSVRRGCGAAAGQQLRLGTRVRAARRPIAKRMHVFGDVYCRIFINGSLRRTSCAARMAWVTDSEVLMRC